MRNNKQKRKCMGKKSIGQKLLHVERGKGGVTEGQGRKTQPKEREKKDFQERKKICKQH